jgi:hypothetical protein
MKFYNESKRLNRYLNPILNDEDEEKISDLLSFAEKYLNLVTLQRERMKSFENFSPSIQGLITNIEHLKAIRLYFGDIHYFFNSAHKFLLFTKRVMKNIGMCITPNFEETEKYYRTIRNHFEHVDERIEKHPLFRKDFSSVSEGKLTIDNVEYDFSDNALPPLYSIFDEVLKSIETIIEPRKEGLDLVWKEFDQRRQSLSDEIYGPETQKD